jgi:cysteine synthase A
MGVGFVPATYRASVVDEVRTVSDDDAWKIARALARNEGLLVGPSSGAAVAIALEIAREIGPGHHVATILADTGERYFSLASHFKHVAELPPLAADRA